MRARLACLLALAGLAFVDARASAQDPLRLNQDPTSFTDVIDAFDEGDSFDLNVHAGFRREQRNAVLRRETLDPTRGVGRTIELGDVEHVRNLLDLGLDIGVFRDVMLYGRLPIVLSDDRRIVAASGAPGDALIAPFPTYDSPTFGVVPGGSPPLFRMPFESPTRSGIDVLQVGLAFDLTNQARRPALPTWMMLFELELGIGKVMKPCEDGAVERDRSTGEPVLVDGATVPVSCDTGVSEGTHAFRFETRLSRRYRHFEPYGGFHFRYAWPGKAADAFRAGGRLEGFQNDRPPVRGGLTAGVAFIPWENRGTWQRFAIDLRADATYVSEGLAYSAVYDALGSSTHPYLAEPNLEGIPRVPNDPGLRTVPFTGLTTVQAHAQVRGTVAIEMQAARYVRFHVGATFNWLSEHALTYGDACNASASTSDPNDPRLGGCEDGLLDPHYRGEIDSPGRRFRLDDNLGFDLFVRATAQF
ncbi:MAG: hypothetical protein MUE69_19440 [Myxococcota bacterium]|jgi:hypothetical protein|nr:hypothetical protein [Myxococcota bacterium]